jgi:glycosyltransferase involved in cell wall biosynthesis
VVIPTLGRDVLQVVIRTCIDREHLMNRLTVVAQQPVSFPAEVHTQATQRGVQLDVVQLSAPIGTASARHVGALRGDEQWLGYLDDDILFEAGSLSQLVQTCEQEGLAGACGVVTDARQNTAAYRIFKRLLFRGIFNDPRALPPDARELVPSPVLSGGLTVYRRDAYLRCADSLRHFSGYSWGEDFELSYCVSALGRLAIDPSVRVRNAASSIADLDPAEIALARLQRYRLFAQRTARERIEWVHYLGVLLGVLVVGVRAGAGRQIWLAVGREALATLSRLARPRTATES